MAVSRMELRRTELRRRFVLWTVLRGIASAAILVTLYYLLPFDRPLNVNTSVRLLIGLSVFAGVTVWQVRSVVGSRFPESFGMSPPDGLVNSKTGSAPTTINAARHT